MSQLIKDIAAHLAKQRKQSLRYDEVIGVGPCAYRGHDGSMCAVGCLIPDEMYDRKIEGRGVDHLLDRYPDVKNHLREKYKLGNIYTNVDLYSALHHAQNYHDCGKYRNAIDAGRNKSDEELAAVIEQEISYLIEN